ncbi:sarcosine oxidase subunit alpha [Coralliovum pocilloporae]|uniref:sarcosine oxidase subunit alpha n=1 Tax=Coralliovum pocilloporae TaxID=3066369 RepID=UPI0033073C22
MTQSYRIEEGGRIDRTKSLSFTFNGESYQGYEGDTLASALLANGVHLVARSFKYHRPRGIMSAGTEEPNAMVQLRTGDRTEPNPKATQIELFNGLVATSVNCWPSVNFDVQAINGVFHRFFAAGFYYKTMFGSPWLWHNVLEPAIQRAAGWGVAPKDPDPDYYDHIHRHCDVLVVGAGPSGLQAALAAAKTGARVVIADEQQEFGGYLLNVNRTVDGKAGSDWAAEVAAELDAMDNVIVLKRTTVFGYFDHNYLIGLERRLDHTSEASSPDNVRQRVWHFRAKRVVLATGAHERPLVFADNDRPGVMLASGAQTYANRFGVLAGKKPVVFTNNDGAYEAALDMKAAGAEIVAIVDTRKNPTGAFVEQARAAGIRIMDGYGVVTTNGKKKVTGVEVMAFDGKDVSGSKISLSCDLLMVSGGWSPVVHLFSQSQGKLRYDDEKAGFVPALYAQKCASVGGANGEFGLGSCLSGGDAAGAEAAQVAGFGDGSSAGAPASEETDAGLPTAAWLIPTDSPVGRSKKKHFIDFQNDSTAADIRLAAREGFESVEHMKRYTLTGFGTDQGKTGNINGLAILSEAVGRSIPETGTTTFRPPYTPVTFGALAGRELGDLSDPVRTTSIHSWHVKNGAEFEDVGQWKRPWYFPKGGEDIHAATNRECLAVRNGVGVLDASTLGKIDIQGPDAAEFINRVYTNAWLKLGVGRCRYGVMCGEDGMIFDDGVTTRLGENHFHMTTTSGGAARVLDWLEEYHQTEWPELKVYFTSVTEQWATVSVGGPKARAVMEALAPGQDWSTENFPFMSVQDREVAGVAARVFRISFTGELGYEINVPTRYGLAMWEAVMEAGKPHGITPYGTEAMHVLRAEKGYIIAGQDTDGTITPQDAGMSWIVSPNKKDYIGKRSYTREDTSRTDRKHLVGLVTEDPKVVLDEGAQVIEDPNAPKPIPMLGHVTSSYWSAALGHSIALATCKNGFNREGDRLYAWSRGQYHAVKVTGQVFYDKEGARKDG